MPKAQRQQAPTLPTVPSQSKAIPAQQKKVATLEDMHLRKVSLYFTIGFCSFSEIASLVTFLFTRSVEGAFIFQLPALLCYYRILCYLYPSNDASSHPFVALVQAIWKHKP
jgi:hypothetical protein